MAANTNAIFVGSIVGKLTAFPAASSTTEVDIFAGDATESTRIDSITLSTDDTAVALLNLYLSDGTNDYQITNIPTTVTAGMTALGATVPVNVLGHANMTGITMTDANGNKFMQIPAGWKLRAKFNASLTSAKTAWIQVRGGKY